MHVTRKPTLSRTAILDLDVSVAEGVERRSKHILTLPAAAAVHARAMILD
jgi:hypothetical protein